MPVNSKWTHQFARWTGILLIAAGSLALLVMSPLAMVPITHLIRAEWTTIGNVGQAYGAVSAVISGLAVAGVALSLVMQVRQNRLNQIQSVRGLQLELMKILLDDKKLAPVSVMAHGVSSELWRQRIFVNLMFNYIGMGFETGYMDEASVSLHAYDYFEQPLVREWWKEVQGRYHLDAKTKSQRLFVQLIDTEFKKAVAATAQDDTPVFPQGSRSVVVRLGRLPSGRRLAAICLIAAVPLVAGIAVVRRNKRDR